MASDLVTCRICGYLRHPSMVRMLPSGKYVCYGCNRRSEEVKWRMAYRIYGKLFFGKKNLY